MKCMYTLFPPWVHSETYGGLHFCYGWRLLSVLAWRDERRGAADLRHLHSSRSQPALLRGALLGEALLADQVLVFTVLALTPVQVNELKWCMQSDP